MPPPRAVDFRRRLVGLYALTVMERQGPAHGYGISEQIAQRTHGAWRPGPGAVYPSLKKLVRSGLARSRNEGRRRMYEITARGRHLLGAIRGRSAGFHEARPDLGALWAEVMGMEGVEQYLERRLDRTLEAVEQHLGNTASPVRARSEFRARIVERLSDGLARIRAARPSPPRGRPPEASVAR